MKLKVKMANEYKAEFLDKYRMTPAREAHVLEIYLAGFEEAREIAVDLVKYEGLDINVLDSLVQLGEEEV